MDGCLAPGTDISEKKVVAFLTTLLQELKKSGNPELAFGGANPAAEQRALAIAEAELESVYNKARGMARLYATHNGTALEHV